MPDVTYVDSTGYAWRMRVKEGTLPTNYGTGIVLGPPDLTDLSLEENELKVLQKALVDAGLINAELIKGSFSKLLGVVRRVFPKKDAKGLANQIKAIYQKDYFQEEK